MLSDKDLNNRLTHVPSVVYPYVIVVLMMNAIKMIDSLSISSLLLSYFRYTGRFCNHYFDEHVFSIIFQLYERIRSIYLVRMIQTDASFINILLLSH